MGTFEGYVRDSFVGRTIGWTMWSLAFCSSYLCVFALMFRTNYRLFLKMMRDVVYVKERQKIY